MVFEDGEKGIDAGGLTREMYAQFAIQTLELPPERRIFRETSRHHVVPEPLAPEISTGWPDLAAKLTSVSTADAAVAGAYVRS